MTIQGYIFQEPFGIVLDKLMATTHHTQSQELMAL